MSETLLEDHSPEFGEGYEAWHQDKKLNGNPHALHSQEKEDWWSGWWEAENKGEKR